jgi:hypothetical protein
VAFNVNEGPGNRAFDDFLDAQSMDVLEYLSANDWFVPMIRSLLKDRLQMAKDRYMGKQYLLVDP